jgi:DNA polymerase-3 subunit epsilon
MSQNLREIVFDTETTGFNFSGDDRIVEIGCVEMLNHTPTGKVYHVYINPEREVPMEVVRVHGLTTEFLADKPKFHEIVDEFLEFIGDANLVAHNATFDMNFLNAELKRLNKPELLFDRVIDTLVLSRKKNPHLSKHNLDALCSRYNIDNSHRDLHGALLDARLLAEVYIELLGGKEVDFFKSNDDTEIKAESTKTLNIKKGEFRPARHFDLPTQDLENHNEFIASLGDKMIWLNNETTSNQ